MYSTATTTMTQVLKDLKKANAIAFKYKCTFLSLICNVFMCKSL